MGLFKDKENLRSLGCGGNGRIGQGVLLRLTAAVPHARFTRGPSPVTVRVEEASYKVAATGPDLRPVRQPARRYLPSSSNAVGSNGLTDNPESGGWIESSRGVHLEG
jgi:hypothetical protein